jgi:hypothetical protein
MERLNHGGANARSSPGSRLFKDAVNAARIAAKQAGETRYVHLGMAGFVVLSYPTPGTVKIVRPPKLRSGAPLRYR